MAELDYAFLADFAQVDGGKLSVIGASYTHAEVRSTSGLWITSVAGRVRAGLDDVVSLSIHVIAPDQSYEVDQLEELQAGEAARPYGDGVVGLLFAVNLALPIVAEGQYEVLLSLDGKQVRRLLFDISVEE